MKQLPFSFIFILTIIAVFSLGFVSFMPHCFAQAKFSRNKKIIVCTTTMITDAVKQIVGDQADVIGLMNAGVDPHLYRATEGDIIKLSTADIIFYHGLHLEGKMGDILKKMRKYTHAIEVSDAIEKKLLIKADCDNIFDPHIWHDVQLWILVTKFISQSVIELDKENQEIYKQRTIYYLEKLNMLDSWIKMYISNVLPEKRVLVTAHDAFSYFGRSYGFSVVGLQGTSTDAQIGTRDIKELARFIAEKKIPAIFVESSVPEKNIKVVQNAVSQYGWHVTIGPDLYSDALGVTYDHNTYIGMITYNIKSIVAALS